MSAKYPEMTGSAEIAAITAIIGPWLFADEGSVRRPMAFRDAPIGPYGFEAIVRAIEPCDMPSTPAGVRAELLRRAEATLDALAEAGWQLSTVPDLSMTFMTEIRPLTQTLAGVMVFPAEQHGIGLKVEFSVDRAR